MVYTLNMKSVELIRAPGGEVEWSLGERDTSVFYHSVSSVSLSEQMQGCTGCICLTFPLCVVLHNLCMKSVEFRKAAGGEVEWERM